MNKYIKYLIMFVSMLCLASTYNFPIPEIAGGQGIYEEVETKSEIEKLTFLVRPASSLLSVLSFPHYLNLRPQLEVLEFLKPPSFVE